jgi:hypothetical protein
MPQFNAVVLKDHAGGDHTFTPRDITSGVATLTEPNGGVPIADRRLSLASTRTTTGRDKRTIKIQVPVVQDGVVNGVSKPAVARVAYVDIAFNFDSTSSTDERADTMAFVSALFKSDQAMIVGFVRDLQGIY